MQRYDVWLRSLAGGVVVTHKLQGEPVHFKISGNSDDHLVEPGCKVLLQAIAAFGRRSRDEGFSRPAGKGLRDVCAHRPQRCWLAY